MTNSFVHAGLALMVEAVAECPTFRTLVGAADSAAARSRIVLYTTGVPGPDAPEPTEGVAVDGTVFSLVDTPHAAVFLENYQKTAAGIFTFDHSVDGVLRVASLRRDGSEQPAEWYARAVATADTITKEIDEQHRFPLLTWTSFVVSSIEDGPQPLLVLVDCAFELKG